MTSASDWTRLKDLFDQVAGLDAAERGLLLDRECAAEPELRRRVEELLASHDAAGGFLAAPTGQTIASPDEARRGAWGLGPGSIIGPYKILQQIGEGGFGVVYMAEQQHPIVRRVALKVIKLGMDTKQVIARFDAERQALALMDHVNIARILDAGATDEGRPFFVMELVHGIPITEYCDREQLPVPERLKLFIPVCHAVAHAHQKGVIHRDLKPSNVLVTLHDGQPVPKVIDFGVARAIHQKLTERTLFTEFGQFIGTPEYMSPEQCEMSGLDIDTRTDIYSLGALLYELLTGQNLFESRRLRSLALKEIQRVLQEEEPPMPSTRVMSLGATAEEVSGHRAVPARHLVRLLRGDPDKIVMKAIAKDRRRRYDSAGALAEDVSRFLRSEPVSARAPQLTYRASRFLRRHRVAAAVATVLLTALVAGGSLALIGLVRARKAEAIARSEAARSVLEADALRAIVRGDEQTYVAIAREAIALRRAARRDPPRVLAHYLADVVCMLGALKLGDFFFPPELDSLLRELESEAMDRVLRLEAIREPRELQVVDALVEYATHHRPDRLLPLYRRSVALRGDLAPSDSSFVEARRRLAAELEAEGRRVLAAGHAADARTLLEEAIVRVREASHWPDPPQLASARGALGASLVELGEYTAAESLLVTAWKRLNSRESLEQLVNLYRRWSKPELAERYAEQRFVDAIREVGVLPRWSGIEDQERCNSGEFQGRAVWLFGRTIVRSNSSAPVWIPNTWCWSRDHDARDGIALQQLTDALGAPRQLIPYTPAERAQLETDTTDAILLQPGSLIEDPARGRALILYTRGNQARNVFSPQREIGSSIALWTDPTAAAVRPALRPGTPEPTLLFQGGEPQFSAGAVVREDMLYLYASRPSFLTKSILVARAPLARALEREAWRFHSENGRWVADWRRATEIMQGGTEVSVHWNQHLRRYLAITSQGLSGEMELRTAPRPEGPWSRPHAIGTGLQPDERRQWSGGAIAHAHLARDGGRRQYVTFRRSRGAFGSEIRVLEIVLH